MATAVYPVPLHSTIGESAEESVLSRARRGDQDAFGELLRSCRWRLFGIVRRVVWRREDVEDVVQEVSLRLFRSLQQLHDEEAFDGWLYRLTMSTVCDYLRRQRRREIRWADLSEEQASIALSTEGIRKSAEFDGHVEAREHVNLLLSRVSEADRTLLIRKEVEGLSVSELEQVYRVTGVALKVRLHRARQRVLRAAANS